MKQCCVLLCFALCLVVTLGHINPLNAEEGSSTGTVVKGGPRYWKLTQASNSAQHHNVLGSGTGCQCVAARDDCGCCAHLDIPKIGINDTGCVNVTYLPKEYGISVTFSLDDRVLFNETISARNPPPVCFGVPYLEKEASLCIDFYNLDITTSTFSGCIKLEARLYHILVEDYDLGCYKMPLGRSWAGMEAKLYTDAKQWLQDLHKLQEKKRLAMIL